jgi:hypothetical protein
MKRAGSTKFTEPCVPQGANSLPVHDGSITFL